MLDRSTQPGGSWMSSPRTGDSDSWAGRKATAGEPGRAAPAAAQGVGSKAECSGTLCGGVRPGGARSPPLLKRCLWLLFGGWQLAPVQLERGLLWSLWREAEATVTATDVRVVELLSADSAIAAQAGASAWKESALSPCPQGLGDIKCLSLLTGGLRDKAGLPPGSPALPCGLRPPWYAATEVGKVKAEGSHGAWSPW